MTVACGGRSAAPPRPNVLLVTIDTFRADRVGTGVAPAIDRLAASGIRFTSARTAVPLTLPSHTTIHTGLLPPAHGVRENGIDALAATHPTIARAAEGRGLRHRGVRRRVRARSPLRPGAGVRHLRRSDPARSRTRPIASKPSARRRPSSIARSRGSNATVRIRESADPQLRILPVGAPLRSPRALQPADGVLARGRARRTTARSRTPTRSSRALLDALRARGLIDHTIVVVAGDHGEGLGDHGERTHGMLVYDSTLRVPLIIAAPGRAAGDARRGGEPGGSRADDPPRRRRHAAGGDEGAGSARGARCAGAMRRCGVRRVRDLYSETEYPRVAGWSPLQALTDGRWMTIRAGASTEVYDLQRDPREEHDVAASQAAIAAAMAARADAIHASAAASRRARDFAGGAGAAALARLRRQFGAAGARRRTRRIRRARIATWNDFEDALSALAGAPPRRAADAAAPRVREPGRAGDPDDLRAGVEGGRPDRRGAGRVSPGGDALADRRDAAPRSRGDGARRGRGRRRGRSATRCATRRRARIRPRSRSTRTAPRRTTASACSPSTPARPPTR